MTKEFDLWAVVSRRTGDLVEGMLTETMSPALRDFYNRSEVYRVVQVKVTYEKED